MQTREQVWPCILDTGSSRRFAENLGGVAETVEKLNLNSSCEAEKNSLYEKRTKSTT